MISETLKNTLWMDWLDNLRLAQRSPYEDTIDIEVDSSSYRKGEDTLDKALRGEWDEVCMEIEDSNIDWRSEQDDSARKNAWEDVLRAHKKDFQGVEWGDTDKDDVLNELFEELEARLQEEEPDLEYGYTEFSFRMTGRADIKIDIEYSGCMLQSEWFRDVEDESGESRRFFLPEKDFIGFLTLMNLDMDMFVSQVKKEVWLDDQQKEEFSQAIVKAFKEYEETFGPQILDPSVAPAVTAKTLSNWLGQLFTAGETPLQSALYATVSLSGPELTELAENFAIAKGNASDALQRQHMTRAWLGAGAHLYDADGDLSVPLVLDAPLLIPTEDQLNNDRDNEGEKATLSFPVIDAWRAKGKVQELMRKEAENGEDLSKRMAYELNAIDFTPGLKKTEDPKLVARLEQLGKAVRPFDESDFRFPPNPAVLDYFVKETPDWKTQNGINVAHAVWGSFPLSTASEFVDRHHVDPRITDKDGNTLAHRVAWMMADRSFFGESTNAFARWLTAETVHTKNNDGQTPVSILVGSKHADLPEKVLEALDNAEVDWFKEGLAGEGKALAQRFRLESHPLIERRKLRKRVEQTLDGAPKNGLAL